MHLHIYFNQIFYPSFSAATDNRRGRELFFEFFNGFELELRHDRHWHVGPTGFMLNKLNTSTLNPSRSVHPAQNKFK